MKLVSIKQEENHYIITAEVGVFRKREKQFYGSGTVWHDGETRRRATTLEEAALADYLSMKKVHGEIQ